MKSKVVLYSNLAAWVVLLTAFIFREVSFARQKRAWDAREFSFIEEIKDFQITIEKAALEATRSEKTILSLRNDLQDARDWAENLDRQVVHFKKARTDLESKLDAQFVIIEAKDDAIASLQAEVLNLQEAPLQLETQLSNARAEIEQQNEQLNFISQHLARLPQEIYTVEGIASNGAVLALKGKVEPEVELPFPVFIGAGNSIITEARVFETAPNLYFCHISAANDALSSLVKGEKVFILPALDL